MSAFPRRLSTSLLCVGFAVGAFAVHSSVSSATDVGTDSGAQVYSHTCQGCHMSSGQGAVGAGHYPKLAGSPALVSWQYVALTVLGGKNGMPAFGLPADADTYASVHLSDAQVADVVNFVRTHFGNKWKSTVTASQVASLPHPAGSSP